MAVTYTCDGCGNGVPDGQMVELGIVKKSQYCPTCTAIAQGFLVRLDQAHEEAAAFFKAKVDEALLDFRTANPDFKELPDGMLDLTPTEQADGE